MPIRLNLLAEAQALEDMRRRDPVKRAIWVVAILVGGMLCWSAYLQVHAMVARAELNGLESQIRAQTNEFQQVVENRRKLDDATRKLAKLHELSTSRFLNGSMLDALQHTTVDDVQLTRLKTDHSYAFTEETKPKTNSNGRVILGKPATVTERITLTLEAKDTSPNPGDQVNRFKEAIADCAYFQHSLGRSNEVRLVNLPAPQPAGPDNKPYQQFTLECKYPEKTR